MFISYLSFGPNLTLQIIPEILNVQILKFFRNLRSLAAEDPSLEEGTQGGFFFIKLKAIQNPGLHLSFSGV